MSNGSKDRKPGDGGSKEIKTRTEKQGWAEDWGRESLSGKG